MTTPRVWYCEKCGTPNFWMRGVREDFVCTNCGNSLKKDRDKKGAEEDDQ